MVSPDSSPIVTSLSMLTSLLMESMSSILPRLVQGRGVLLVVTDALLPDRFTFLSKGFLFVLNGKVFRF